MSIDLSIVIPVHREGRTLHPTLQSALRSVAYAAESGAQVEVVLLLDRADEATEAYARNIDRPEVSIYRVDHGDPGMSRNEGVDRSRGEFVSFIDADDLVGENWAAEVVRSLREPGEDVILHPEYHVVFEAEDLIWRLRSSTDPGVQLSNQIEANYWSVVAAGRRSLMQQFPYSRSERGFGFEDWKFNCETLAAGIEHRIVPETVVFLRRKHSGSKLTLDLATTVLRPCKFFAPEVFRKMCGGPA